MLNQVYNTVEMPDAVSNNTIKRQAPAVHTLRCRASQRGGFALGDSMEEKRCTKCKEPRPISSFCKNKNTKDGLSCWCRICKRIPEARYRENHPEKVKAFRRRKTIKWRAENPEKRRAQQIAYRAIKAGKLVRPDKCEICGNPTPILAHHPDYSKPLEVEWTCYECHWKRDEARRKESTP